MSREQSIPTHGIFLFQHIPCDEADIHWELWASLKDGLPHALVDSIMALALGLLSFKPIAQIAISTRTDDALKLIDINTQGASGGGGSGGRMQLRR